MTMRILRSPKLIGFLLAFTLLSATWEPAQVIALRAFGQSSQNTSTARTATPRCRREDLSIKEGETDAAMGGVRQTPYIFTNISASPCTLSGYPAAELRNRQGRIVRRSTRLQSDESSGVVTIEPGKTAWFGLNYNSGGAGYMGKPCPTYSKLRIVAPGAGPAFVLHSAITTCARTNFEVSPVRSGLPN